MNARSEPREGPRPNERLLISHLRRMGPASKPDLARAVALTPQAVHGIIDGLMQAGLVEAGGRREGLVGHPSTLYAIKPGGAFGIGVEIGLGQIETALVDFTGQMAYRGRATHARLDAGNVVEAVLGAIEATLAHASSAGIEASRIAGVGIVESSTDAAGDNIAEAIERAMLQHGRTRLLVHVERQVVAGALFLATFSPAPLPQNCLFVTLAHGVDGCLMLDGAVRERRERSRFALLPISASETLDDVAGFGRLAARLGVDATRDLSTEEFFRATQADPATFETWLNETATALATAVAAVHALHAITHVFIDVAPPLSVGDMLIERTIAKLNGRTSGTDRPKLSRIAPPFSPALPAGTVALHALYAPGGAARSVSAPLNG